MITDTPTETLQQFILHEQRVLNLPYFVPTVRLNYATQVISRCAHELNSRYPDTEPHERHNNHAPQN